MQRAGIDNARGERQRRMTRASAIRCLENPSRSGGVLPRPPWRQIREYAKAYGGNPGYITTLRQSAGVFARANITSPDLMASLVVTRPKRRIAAPAQWVPQYSIRRLIRT